MKYIFYKFIYLNVEFRPKTAKAGWIPDIKTAKGNTNNIIINNYMNK